MSNQHQIRQQLYDRARELVPVLKKRSQEAANAMMVVSDLKTILFNNFDILCDRADNEAPLDIEERVKMRYDSAVVGSRCADAITELYLHCGSAGIFNSHKINQVFRDIQTGRTHVDQPAKYARNFGGVVMGRETTDFFL